MKKRETKKKRLLVIPAAAKDWIGGVYYIKNILFSMMENHKIKDTYEIHLFVDDNLKKIFSQAFPGIKLHTFTYKNDSDMFVRIVYLYFRYRCRIVFPIPMYRLVRFGIKGIFWIPDFQHNHLPECFSQEECAYRNMRFQKILGSEKNAVVLSSSSALDDAEHYYKIRNKKIHTVHFVSYIEDEIRRMNQELESKIMLKYGLQKNQYIYVANQFWKHKNHIVIAKAVRLLEERGELSLDFVFTGEMKDYRNPEYIEELKDVFAKVADGSRIKMLGLIPRDEQICVMKHASFVIQPSLFEGWGTVLEDCKVLDKTVLLSSIQIHLEQKNERCILFDPYNEEELAQIIAEEQKYVHESDIEKGLNRMHKDALQYSFEIESVLNEFDMHS